MVLSYIFLYKNKNKRQSQQNTDILKFSVKGFFVLIEMYSYIYDIGKPEL